jgi:hypothetical protein
LSFFQVLFASFSPFNGVVPHLDRCKRKKLFLHCAILDTPIAMMLA